MSLTRILNSENYSTNNLTSPSPVDGKKLGVEEMPDVPNYESSAIKRKLDEIAKYFLAPFINHLIGEIEAQYATKEEVQEISGSASGGAMLQLVYDTQKKNTDIFKYADSAASAAGSNTLAEAKSYTDTKATFAQNTATKYTDEKLANCYISFTDENGAPTDEPYIHWDTPD